MKATGIVRRIDELGRLVIPKEIRRVQRIREGDPMEIFTDNEGGIILKKYSPISELGNVAGNYVQALYQATGLTACVTDKDTIVSAAGMGKRNLEGKAISKQLEDFLEERGNSIANRGDKNYINITHEGYEEFYGQAISSIICQGDVMGAVVLLGRDETEPVGELEKKLVKGMATVIGMYMEA